MRTPPGGSYIAFSRRGIKDKPKTLKRYILLLPALSPISEQLPNQPISGIMRKQPCLQLKQLPFRLYPMVCCYTYESSILTTALFYRTMTIVPVSRSWVWGLVIIWIRPPVDPPRLFSGKRLSWGPVGILTQRWQNPPASDRHGHLQPLRRPLSRMPPYAPHSIDCDHKRRQPGRQAENTPGFSARSDSLPQRSIRPGNRPRMPQDRRAPPNRYPGPFPVWARDFQPSSIQPYPFPFPVRSIGAREKGKLEKPPRPPHSSPRPPCARRGFEPYEAYVARREVAQERQHAEVVREPWLAFWVSHRLPDSTQSTSPVSHCATMR